MSRVTGRQLILPGIAFVAFWSVAVAAWWISGYVQPLSLFGYIGTSLGVGFGLYATLPKKQKQRGRKLARDIFNSDLPPAAPPPPEPAKK